MKRKFKAFTLIELIIVIAIFGIIMTGLMNFFRPIRETYVDSTLYEQQRTTQNGILEYLCETTRYADAMYIYDNGSKSDEDYPDGSHPSAVTSARAAFEDFCKHMNITDADAKKKVKVLVINRASVYDKSGAISSSTATSSDSADVKYGNALRGRIITCIDGTEWPTTANAEAGLRCSGVGDGATYMALGGAYYGVADYDIYIDWDNTANSNTSFDGVTFCVVSSMRNTGNVVVNGGTNGGSSIDVDGGAVTLKTVQKNVTKNLQRSKKFKYFNDGTPYGTITPTGSISGGSKNTYIVFTVPSED